MRISSGYFDNIDQSNLMELVERAHLGSAGAEAASPVVEAGVLEDGTVRETLAGTPQGGVISPLLANVYLNDLDRIWADRCGHLGILVRYADDFVTLCGSEALAKEALERIKVISPLGLNCIRRRPGLVDLRRGQGSFVFLGCTIRKKRSIQRESAPFYATVAVA